MASKQVSKASESLIPSGSNWTTEHVAKVGFAAAPDVHAFETFTRNYDSSEEIKDVLVKLSNALSVRVEDMENEDIIDRFPKHLAFFRTFAQILPRASIEDSPNYPRLRGDQLLPPSSPHSSGISQQTPKAASTQNDNFQNCSATAGSEKNLASSILPRTHNSPADDRRTPESSLGGLTPSPNVTPTPQNMTYKRDRLLHAETGITQAAPSEPENMAPSQNSIQSTQASNSGEDPTTRLSESIATSSQTESYHPSGGSSEPSSPPSNEREERNVLEEEFNATIKSFIQSISFQHGVLKGYRFIIHASPALKISVKGVFPVSSPDFTIAVKIGERTVDILDYEVYSTVAVQLRCDNRIGKTNVRERQIPSEGQ